jgi:hypothetical protein
MIRISKPLQRGLEITLTWLEGCPEVFQFLTQTKATGAGPGGADTRSSRRGEIGTGAVAFLLADLARREHRQPEMRPRTSLRKAKLTALGAVKARHAPQTGHPKEEVQGSL